jgi:hypothetical protein
MRFTVAHLLAYLVCPIADFIINHPSTIMKPCARASSASAHANVDASNDPAAAVMRESMRRWVRQHGVD